MKLSKYLGIAIIAVILLVSRGCASESFVHEKENLRVVVEQDTPGFFIHNNIPYGYMYDILREYARHLDKTITLTKVATQQEVIRLLECDSADIALSIKLTPDIEGYDNITELGVEDSETLVVIARDRKNINSPEELAEMMQGSRVAVTASVEHTPFYEQYKDSLSGINFQHFDSLSNREIAHLLAYNKADYLICTKTLSALYRYIYRSFHVVSEIPDLVYSDMYISSSNRKLYKSFNDWYWEQYMFGEAKKHNDELYKTGLYMDMFIKNGYLVSYNALSPYDNLFKEIGQKYNIDWRLLSSIAHFESRYNRNLVSKAGAVGLMQIMPHTARSYKFNVDSLLDPKYNISASAHILSDIRRMLSITQDTLTEDQLAIILASYNAGIGRVLDAREAAKGVGASSQSWSGIKKGINHLSKDRYDVDSILVYKSKFKGKETVYYVNKVIGRYNKIKEFEK